MKLGLKRLLCMAPMIILTGTAYTVGYHLAAYWIDKLSDNDEEESE